MNLYDRDNVEEFYDEYTGFDSEKTQNENDIALAGEILSRQDIYRSLVEHSGWKLLEEELKAATDSWISLLKKSDNIEEIRKIQAFIYVFELFPGIIEKAFVEADSISSRLTQYIGTQTPETQG